MAERSQHLDFILQQIICKINHGVNENSLQDIQLLATHLYTTTKVKLILFLSEFINMVHVNARHSGTKNFPEKLCSQCWQQLLELCKA